MLPIENKNSIKETVKFNSKEIANIFFSSKIKSATRARDGEGKAIHGVADDSPQEKAGAQIKLF